MPQLITGYHGCHADVAKDIVAGVGFLPSENGYDWLGKGIYFWEDAPNRAGEWAKRRFGGDGAVVRAIIDLGHCLNLLDTAHFDRMEESFEKVIYALTDVGLDVPSNTRKLHKLDYAVIEFYCSNSPGSGADAFQTVRGCFPEGKPLYPGSKILRETHIQVAVRDSLCLLDLTVVN